MGFWEGAGVGSMGGVPFFPPLRFGERAQGGVFFPSPFRAASPPLAERGQGWALFPPLRFGEGARGWGSMGGVLFGQKISGK